jgi:four helix bundle protein
MRKIDLEDRLIEFSVLIIKIADSLPNTLAGKTLSGQIIRSGISVALNYGEALGAESRKDFIHKIKIILKELKETFINLKIIHKSKTFKNENLIINAKKENNELISIFVSSIKTAKQNLKLTRPEFC